MTGLANLFIICIHLSISYIIHSFKIVTGSLKTCQISPFLEIDFDIFFEEKYVLNKILFFYSCKDMAEDKQLVKGAIVETFFQR